MKTHLKLILYTLLFVCGYGSAYSQTPTDGIMMKKREACIALTYDHSAWDHYWEGTMLRKNATVATVKRVTVVPMLAVGIVDNLNLLLALPYVKTSSSEPNGGKFEGAKGFQDLGLFLKGQFLKREIGKGDLYVFGTAGFATPMTNYLSDYRPYSIGNGTSEFSLRGIVQYKLDNGFFVRTAFAHLWRGLTEAERDYYYNNGSYYTSLMDVPSAWNYHGVVGKWLFNNALRLEASYEGLSSTSGDDIRAYNAPQPTNKVNYGQIGFFAQYFSQHLKGVGALAYYSQVVNGRNMGKSTTIGAGLTYQFKF